MNRTKKKSKFLTLRYFAIGYEFKFDPIKAYLEKSREMIQEQEEKLKKKLEEWDKKNDKNPEIPDAYDIYETEIMNTSEFAELLNKSIYMAIYSTFENEFFSLCEWCQKSENLNLGPKDIKESSYIGQCRKYLSKVMNVNLVNLNGQWSEIKNYQMIRNAIAHNSGILIEPKETIVRFISETDGIPKQN